MGPPKGGLFSTIDMSTIRELIQETNAQGVGHPIFKEMQAKLGKDIQKAKPQVTVLDKQEVAVVFISEQPVGLLTIDWSEPCLEFKPLKDA